MVLSLQFPPKDGGEWRGRLASPTQPSPHSSFTPTHCPPPRSPSSSLRCRCPAELLAFRGSSTVLDSLITALVTAGTHANKEHALEPSPCIT
ncbi:hypothetical protein ACN47E_007442 [Coniothyrium glycines]